MPDCIISMKNLTRKFDDFIAVNSISMDIKKGELFGLIGPNGAGKTTLLKMLSGQLEATSGSARVLGFDPSKESLNVKRYIGIVPEIEMPPSFLTGVEYLQYVGLIRNLDDIDERVMHWIEFLDMKDVQNVPGKDLSKGTRQKLMIAAAFIHEPKLVFLDEPFIGLDPLYQKKIKEHMIKYLDDGGTIFMCTHILEIAEKMCTIISIINRGGIVSTGTPKELIAKDKTLDSAFLRLIQTEDKPSESEK